VSVVYIGGGSFERNAWTPNGNADPCFFVSRNIAALYATWSLGERCDNTRRTDEVYVGYAGRKMPEGWSTPPLFVKFRTAASWSRTMLFVLFSTRVRNASFVTRRRRSASISPRTLAAKIFGYFSQ